MSVATPALPVRAARLWAALLAATLMNLPLGSVYAFSVLLRPIEQELAIPRSALSLVFGLATVGFTVGSVGAAFLYRVAPAPILVLASALTAAGGLLMAATATGLAQLLLGYGIVFGTGGGVTYILLQQGVNMLVQQRRGLRIINAAKEREIVCRLQQPEVITDGCRLLLRLGERRIILDRRHHLVL